MNLKELKEIISLMKESGLSELEIEKEGFRIRLKKQNDQITFGDIAPEKISLQAPTREPLAQIPAGAALPQALAANELIIRSPMVGTFYASPAPDQPPYVNIGTVIQPDDVLCIIEAMKLMNEIKAESGGRVVEILVENGSAVEFDQPLFKVVLP
ncbi:MAG: acetyl-CoA carboxylase biotin carboxyl carrier protein [Candidatus Omnitrophica bacterium]|nr:acetyl-CoA carboxylase biotin carboxyl carrier protein [Candidatus Omnitrophota bacterium]